MSKKQRKKSEDENEEETKKFETEVNGNEFGVMRFFIMLEALPEEPEAATLCILQLATSLVNRPYLTQELALILGRLIVEESDCNTEACNSYPIISQTLALALI